jgi:hypothetical protein
LPLLHSLGLSWLTLESVEPLGLAPQLRELFLSACAYAPPAPAPRIAEVQWRAVLPAMPLLERLALFDAPHCAVTLAQADDLNRALLARLPRLTPAHFHQNLLPAGMERNNRRRPKGIGRSPSPPFRGRGGGHRRDRDEQIQ